MNARVRLTILSISFILILGLIGLLCSIAIVQNDSYFTTMSLVGIVFGGSISIGLGVLIARLVGSQIRSTALQHRVPDPKVVFSLFWSSSAWERVGVRGKTSPASQIGSWLFSTICVTANEDGLIFWCGVRRPKPARTIDWGEVGPVRLQFVSNSWKSYPFLEIELRGEGHLLFQVESQSTFGPIAGSQQLIEMARSIDAFRPASVALE